MKAIIIVAILCVAAANELHSSPPHHFKRIDKECLLGFMKCYHEQLLNGNPQLGIPSHNPYIQHESFNITKQLGRHLYEKCNLHNLKWTGKADFTYHFVEIPCEHPLESEFNFTITWKKWHAVGEWKRFADFYGFTHRDYGTVKIDILDPVWKGNVKICPKGVKIQLRSTVNAVKFTITHMDNEKIAVEAYFSNYFRLLHSCDLHSKFLSKMLSEKFTKEWLFKPHKIEALKNLCPR